MNNFNLLPYNENDKIVLKHFLKNYLIDKIEPIYLSERVLTSEISTYNIKKIYLAKEISFSESGDVISIPYVIFYDINNIMTLRTSFSNSYWNNLVNERRNLAKIFTLKNVLFSRVLRIYCDRFNMLGYRITLQ